MTWWRATTRKGVPNDRQLINETRRLREQLVAVASKLEVYLGAFQEEVEHQRESDGTGEGGLDGPARV